MGLNTPVTQSVLIATTLITATIGIIFYKKYKKAKIPSNWEKVGVLKKLHLYPLKSGHRIELKRGEITIFGLKQTKEDGKVFQLRDRVLVVYGANDNEYRTGRTNPKMLKIKVSIRDEDHLAVDAPGMETLCLKIPTRGGNSVVDIKCVNFEKIQGIDCGDEAASWFSRYIIESDHGLRLAYNDATQKRDVIKAHPKLVQYYKLYNNETSGLFSDFTSVSLISVPSVGDLDKRVSNSDITAEQFRHNLIVDGLNVDPYDEDNWDWVRVGEEVIMRNVKDCTRCVETTVDPKSGIRHPGREPLKTLQTYRKNDGPETNSPRLGIHLGVVKTGFIDVGDSIYVSRK